MPLYTLEPLSVDLITKVLTILNHNGLLFVWLAEDKLWSYVTGKEAGRLPEPTRRHLRKTPPWGKDTEQRNELWPTVVEYLSTFKSLQPRTDGILCGYISHQSPTNNIQPSTNKLRADSAIPQNTTHNTKQPTTTYTNHTKQPQSPTLARTGADLEHNHDLEHEQDHEHDPSSSASSSNKFLRRRTASKTTKQNAFSPQKILLELSGKMENRNGSSINLRKKLEAGIHRKQMFHAYEDARLRKKGINTAAEWMHIEAVKSLMQSRGFKELNGVSEEVLHSRSWKQVEKGISTARQIKDYDERRKQFCGFVINVVVTTAMELQQHVSQQGKSA